MATSKGYEAVARLLLEHGADLNARTKVRSPAGTLRRCVFRAPLLTPAALLPD